MATEELVVVTADRTGASEGLTAVTTADGFKFPNDGRTFLLVSNDGVGAKVLAFLTHVTVDGKAVGDAAATVLVAEHWFVGPFPVRYYNDDDGFCVCSIDVDLDGIAAISIPTAD